MVPELGMQRTSSSEDGFGSCLSEGGVLAQELGVQLFWKNSEN